MGTILDVLGIVFIIIVVVVLVGGFLVRRKLRAIAKSLAGYAAQPSEIHLEEEAKPTWVARPPVQDMMKDLSQLGFTPGRAYSIQEMPQVQLCSFFRTDLAIACALYQHDSVGNWVDLVVKYEDGTGVTVTNAPSGEELDSRPNGTKVFLKDASLTELHRELERRLERKATCPIDDVSFQKFFEESYKEDMEWRNKKGGVTLEEVRRVASKQDQEIGEPEIAEAMRQIKSGELFQLHRECIENFTRANSVSTGEGDQDSEALFVVSDRVDAASYVEYLRLYLDLSEEQSAQLDRLSKVTTSARVLFMIGNASLPRKLRAAKIGSVRSPIDADIYQAPLQG